MGESRQLARRCLYVPAACMPLVGRTPPSPNAHGHISCVGSMGTLPPPQHSPLLHTSADDAEEAGGCKGDVGLAGGFRRNLHCALRGEVARVCTRSSAVGT